METIICFMLPLLLLTAILWIVGFYAERDFLKGTDEPGYWKV